MGIHAAYLTPFAVAASGIFAVGIAALRRRNVRGAMILFFLCAAAGIWSISEGLLYLGSSGRTSEIVGLGEKRLGSRMSRVLETARRQLAVQSHNAVLDESPIMPILRRLLHPHLAESSPVMRGRFGR